MEVEISQFVECAINTQSPTVQIRKDAEQKLRQLQANPKALALCHAILEQRSEPLAWFHALVMIRDFLVTCRDYNEKQKWVGFLLQLLEGNFNSMAAFVRNTLIQTLAISTKLAWNNPSDNVSQTVVNTMAQYLQQDQNHQLIGLHILLGLLNEFESTKSSNVGLNLDFHQSCQASFQKTHLLHCFQLVLTIIHASIDSESQLQSVSIHCAERILSWNFISNANALMQTKQDIDSKKDKAPLTLPLEWKSFVSTPAVVQLFFQLQNTHLNNPILLTKVSLCLVQLAGIQGPVFDTAQTRIMFISNFVSCFQANLNAFLQKLNAGNAGPMMGELIFNYSQIAKNLLRTPIHLLAQVEAICPLLENLGNLTIVCNQHNEDEDETWILDAGDEFLLMWSSFVENASDYGPKELEKMSQDAKFAQLINSVSSISAEIVNRYISKRVTSLPGEGDDDEFKDVDLYSDQLINMSILARMKPDIVLQQLQVVLREKTSQLQQFFANCSHSNAESGMILQEHIHWAVLISGHILADSSFGEVPTIPQAILILSNNSPAGADPVVGLANSIFAIFDSVSFPAESIQHSFCSPLLIETLFWFVDRWGTSYLFPDKDLYSNIPSSIESAFGHNPQGVQVLNYIITKIRDQIRLWITEKDVVSQIITSLQGLSKNRVCRDEILKSSVFASSIQYLLANVSYLPQTVHSSVVQTIAYIATHASDPAQRSDYFNRLAHTIENSLNSLIQGPTFAANYNSTNLRERIIVALEMFGGLVLAIDETTTVPIFEICARNFSTFIKLLNLYHSYPDVELYILQIFRDLIKLQAFDELSPGHQELLFKATLELVNVYSSNEVGRHRSKNDLEEEELFEDISTLFEILAGLITAEYEGFERETVLAKIKKQHFEVDVSVVVFTGVNSLLPLITTEMLQFPRLCLDYMTLVGLLIEYFPDRLSSLPPSLLNSLMQSLLFGTQQSLGRIPDHSFKAIQSLSLYIWSQILSKSAQGDYFNYLIEALELLLTEIFQGILMKPFDPVMLKDAADCIFALTLACPKKFESLIVELTSGPSMASLSEKLSPMLSSIQTLHTQFIQKFSNGQIEIGWGSSGLERFPSLNPYRSLFSAFVMETRAKLHVK